MIATEEAKPPVKGLHAHRLAPEQNNPREVALIQQWDIEESRSLLDQLWIVYSTKDDPEATRVFSAMTPCGSDYLKRPIGEPTDRDRTVARTVIQWLGSNVGMGFLHEAFRKAGYQIDESSTIDKLRRELRETKKDKDALTKERDALRVAFAEASHNAGPAFVAHEELAQLRAENDALESSNGLLRFQLTGLNEAVIATKAQAAKDRKWAQTCRVQFEHGAMAADRFQKESMALRACLRKLLENFGVSDTWPLTDIIAKLCEATRHLRDEHDCDTNGHEAFWIVMEQAETILPALRESIGTALQLTSAPTTPAQTPADRVTPETVTDLSRKTGETQAHREAGAGSRPATGIP